MTDCNHSLGYVLYDDGKGMKCTLCGHTREIVSIPAWAHNEGFRLSRTKVGKRKYEYALTQWGEPVKCKDAEHGDFSYLVPTSVANALEQIRQLLIDT